MDIEAKGHPLGLHRGLDEVQVIPQNAHSLNPEPPILSNEILVSVEFLQIDSASFHQLTTENKDEETLKQQIAQIINARGKMQNPVTGSGGMLLGEVVQIGKNHPDDSIKVGEKIATLISLTATPLKLLAIKTIDYKRERVFVDATAILFETSLYSHLPEGISPGALIAAFDICGAPKHAINNVKEGDVVLLLGLGKAAVSVMSSLRSKFGNKVKLLGIDVDEDSVNRAKMFGADATKINAKDPIATSTWVSKNSDGKLADVTINLVNVPDTEMPTVMCTRDGGKCLFFSMATDFQKATLGSESVAKDVELIMGSGFTKGHSDHMIELLNQDAELRSYFEANFGD